MDIKNKKIKNRDNIHYYILIAPFLVLFTVFMVLPVFSSMVLSLFNFDMVSLPKFTGIDNYIRMFVDDSVFLITLKNTLVLAAITGPAGFLLAFVLEIGRAHV